MKFYSEELNKIFDTAKELKEAEEKMRKDKMAAAEAKKEILEAVDACIASIEHIYDLIDNLKDDRVAAEIGAEASHKLLSFCWNLLG